MKIPISVTVLFLVYNTAFCQLIYSNDSSRYIINGVCLCKTTLAELQEQSTTWKEVSVAEMDLPPSCFGDGDSRYTNGKGYVSDKYPGMIFQEGNVPGSIGKIRLTEVFKGRLPDGNPIYVSELTVSEILRQYPQADETWSSRDCSEHYRLFYNDVVNFFVKIDRSLLPQYPVKTEAYMDRLVSGIDLVASCRRLNKDKPVIKLATGDRPIMFLDSIQVNEGVVKLYDPEDMAFVTVVKGENAIKLKGEEGKNGIIFLFTKEYCLDKVHKMLRPFDPKYERVASAKPEDVAYFVNGEIDESIGASLFETKPSEIISATVIKGKEVQKKYNIKGMKWGVEITMNVE